MSRQGPPSSWNFESLSCLCRITFTRSATSQPLNAKTGGHLAAGHKRKTHKFNSLLRERATGLEPATSSLGSGQKTIGMLRKSLIFLRFSPSHIQYALTP